MSFPRYKKYKDSGVEWLGEVPTEWSVKRVKHLFEIRKRISGSEGYAVLSITQQGIKVKDIESGDGQISMDYSKYQFVEVGDFAMNHMDLLTGYVDISSIFGVTSPDYRVFAVRDRSACFDRYYLYLFQAGYKNKIFYAFGQGSSQLGRWRFPTEQFNSFECPEPPFEEQQVIAAFLDLETSKIDILITEQQKLIDLLKEKRQAVISHAVTKGLNPDVPMKDSGVEWLGEVPEHWEVKKMKHLSSRISSGKTPLGGSEVYVDEGITFLRSQNVYDEGLRLDDVVFITAAIDEAMAVSRAIPNDILLNITGASIGRSCVIPSNFPPANVNQHVCVIRLEKTSQVLFVGWYFKSANIKNQIDHAQNGAAREGLNFVQIGELSISLPPKEEQSAIATFLDLETAKVDTLTSEAQTTINLLQERRTALISAAVTGKIDVRGLVVEQPKVEAIV